MSSSYKLGEVSVISETNQTLFLAVHKSTRELKFVAEECGDYVKHEFFVTRCNVNKGFYPLTNSSGEVVYYDGAKLSFTSGSVVGVRKVSTNNYQIGYMEANEFVIFGFSSVNISFPCEFNEDVVCDSNPQSWFSGKWVWIIGLIILFILIIVLIIFLVRKSKKKSQPTSCLPVDTCTVAKLT